LRSIITSLVIDPVAKLLGVGAGKRKVFRLIDLVEDWEEGMVVRKRETRMTRTRAAESINSKKPNEQLICTRKLSFTAPSVEGKPVLL
jgi:hypothetical protein